MDEKVTETGEMLIDGEVKTDEEVASIIEKLTRARETAREIKKRYEAIRSILKKHGGQDE